MPAQPPTLRETLGNLVGIVWNVTRMIVKRLLFYVYTAIVGVVRIVFLFLRVVTLKRSDKYVLDPLYEYCFSEDTLYQRQTGDSWDIERDSFAAMSLRERIAGVFTLPFSEQDL